MIANLLQKVLVPTAVGTVIGFTAIFGAANSAAAFEGKIETPVKNAISHVVLYLQDGEGDISAVKIDNFSNVSDDIKQYDPSSFLEQRPGETLVAYEVKAGRDKYPTLLTIDELPEFRNRDIEVEQYADFPNPPENTSSSEGTTSNSNTQSGTPTYVNTQESSTKKVKVPEPGSIAAIAIFGISGLIAKKKISS